MPSAPAVIEADALTKYYGFFPAVDHICFAVEEGEVFGFLGPNGAGKTTTMRMCECVSPRSGGSLKVLGRDPAHHARAIKREVGVVPQETNLDPEFSALENLIAYSRYFDIPRREGESRAEELIKFVELTERANTPIEQLSGGMKRRLILARALVNEPRLLILDEPTIGLDPQARHLIWDRLRSIRAEGKTIVLTTHYLDEAARLCDRLVIMDHGKILVEGEPDALVQKEIGGEIVETEYSPEVEACLTQHGIPFEVAGEVVQVQTRDVATVTGALLAGCSIGRVITRRATLEDVFLKLTGRRLRE